MFVRIHVRRRGLRSVHTHWEHLYDNDTIGGDMGKAVQLVNADTKNIPQLLTLVVLLSKFRSTR